MIEKLSNNDIKKIVDIHMEVLSDDLLPQLGSKYLLSFYQYLNQSEKEIIFIKKEENIILGCCIVSLEPKTLLKRVIKFSFTNFIISLIIKFFLKQKLRKYVFNIVTKSNKTVSKYPEIAYIFINKNFQSNGIGKELIENARMYLLNKEYTKLYVKTIDNVENKAISFYRQNNFFNYTNFQYAGNKYLYLEKKLNV